jgi:hypothetical protein
MLCIKQREGCQHRNLPLAGRLAALEQRLALALAVGRDGTPPVGPPAALVGALPRIHGSARQPLARLR